MSLRFRTQLAGMRSAPESASLGTQGWGHALRRAISWPWRAVRAPQSDPGSREAAGAAAAHRRRLAEEPLIVRVSVSGAVSTSAAAAKARAVNPFQCSSETRRCARLARHFLHPSLSHRISFTLFPPYIAPQSQLANRFNNTIGAAVFLAKQLQVLLGPSGVALLSPAPAVAVGAYQVSAVVQFRILLSSTADAQNASDTLRAATGTVNGTVIRVRGPRAGIGEGSSDC